MIRWMGKNTKERLYDLRFPISIGPAIGDGAWIAGGPSRWTKPAAVRDRVKMCESPFVAEEIQITFFIIDTPCIHHTQ